MARASASSRALVTFAVPVLLCLSWQGWVAGRNGLSDVYARPAIHYLEGKSAANLHLSDVEWQAVYKSLSRANALMPGNPEYLDRLGWLEQTKVSMLADTLDIVEVDARARAAEQYYRSAVGSRPTWPNYWGNLALQMHSRGNFDTDEYSAALANAARFGPWMNDTQGLVAGLGSVTLESLSPQAQRAILLNLERGLNRQSKVMLSIIHDWGIVCETANVPDDSLPLLSNHCKRDNDN